MTPPPLTATQILQSIWAALRRIEDNLALPPAPLELPAPVVHVPPPDLADLVNAVASLNGTGPSAEEIARALADVLAPALPASQGADALGEVARALEKLDFRLRGMGTAFGGGGSVTLASGQAVGISNWDQMPAGETGLAKDATLTGRLPDLVGTWSYYAGTSGTVNVAAGERVIGIAAHATTAGSVTIAGGTPVPLPANSGIQFSPQGNLAGPVAVVFVGTDSYAVEVLGA